jgi:hypothetical protein
MDKATYESGEQIVNRIEDELLELKTKQTEMMKKYDEGLKKCGRSLTAYYALGNPTQQYLQQIQQTEERLLEANRALRKIHHVHLLEYKARREARKALIEEDLNEIILLKPQLDLDEIILLKPQSSVS